MAEGAASLQGFRCGEHAVLVEVPAGTAVGWAAALARAPIAGQEEVVPAESTLLVVTSGALTVQQVLAHLGKIGVPAAAGDRGPLVTIDVHYDGPDLSAVATACGLSVDDVVSVHSGADFVVAFCGFAPGFAYLQGLPPRLALPRRATPRVAVPAGSVAIAAQYSAIYPQDSPGGWHLIGHTEHPLFDAEATQPATLTPGTRVRFRPT